MSHFAVLLTIVCSGKWGG